MERLILEELARGPRALVEIMDALRSDVARTMERLQSYGLIEQVGFPVRYRFRLGNLPRPAVPADAAVPDYRKRLVHGGRVLGLPCASCGTPLTKLNTYPSTVKRRWRRCKNCVQTAINASRGKLHRRR